MDVADLYGLPLDRFVTERGALARALRADGRREEAAEVASLRRPSIAAWAVNQLVRTQPRGVDELFAAGDAMRAAEADVLGGRGDGPALRAAGDRERAAVQTLVDAARGLLTSEGHELSPAVIERVGETLHAAGVGEEARAQLRDGRLERELRHVGLGGVDAAGPAPPRPATGGAARKKPSRAGRPAARRDAAARAEPDRAKAEHDRAEAQRAEPASARPAARAAETPARRRAERAVRALRVAQERRDRAARALGEADEALATAHGEAEAAADAYRHAREQPEDDA